jgi:hypothetical protein
MTQVGGLNNEGVIYKYDISLNTTTKLFDFSANASGSGPAGTFIERSPGILSGATPGGGANGAGVLFEFNYLNSSYSKKFDFGGLNGENPYYTKLLRIDYPRLNASGNGETIALGGTPLASNHTDFGKLAAGGSVTKTFTITNTGTGILTLSANAVLISGSTDFTVSTQPPAGNLAPNASTTFEVTFTPTTSGTQTATVSVASNEPNTPFTFDVHGETNTALDFDGTNDYVDLGSLTAINGVSAFTFETWVYRTANGTDFPTLFSKSTSGWTNTSVNIGGWTPSAGIYATISIGLDAYGYNNSVVAMPLNTWSHIAVVFDGSGSTNLERLKIYVDGLPVALAFVGSIPPYAPTNPFNAFLGHIVSSPYYFPGKMDETRIWNRALCQQEIAGRMISGLQGNENGLVAYYDFEEGIPGGTNTTLTQVLDKANLNHGTLLNFAKTGATSNWVNGNTLTGTGTITGTAITWLGTTADWNTPSNWSPANVPTQCNDVVIPATANNPTFSNNQAVNSITINTGASLTVGAGGCLWVGSTFTNNGDFVLEATASNYAQYQGPQVKGALSQVIGEAGWHNIASPFIDATLGDINFTNGGFLQFGAPNLCNIHYYDSDLHQATPPGSWNTAWGNWVCATNATDAFDGSRAYTLFLDNGFASSFPVTMTVTGTLRNMPLTQTLNGANGGWNQVSNPFPSVIDWDKLYDNSAINNTYYLWNPATQTYVTYMVGGTSVPANAATRYIAPFQSVFVKTSNGQNINSGDEPNVFQNHLTSNADRPTNCPSTINEFFKTELTSELHIEARTANGLFADEFAIRFGNSFSEGFVADEEAVKFFSPNENVPALYAIIENQPFVISSFPQPEVQIQHIPLGVKANVGERLNIAALEIPEGITAILEDKASGTFQNLNSSYGFVATKALDNNRFVLHLGDEHLSANHLGASADYLVYPADGKLHFVYNEKLFGGEATLSSMSGQIVAKTTVTENGSMDVTKLPIGLYIITVQNQGKVYTQKVVVK